MYNIKEIDNTDISLTEQQLLALEEFKTKIVTTGVVNRSSVLALEEFVGGVVTKMVKINKLTEHDSHIATDEVLDAIEPYLNGHEVNKEIKLKDLYNMENDAKYSLLKLKEVLVKYNNDGISDFLANASNEKYRIVYSWDNKDKLIDIFNEPILEVIKYDNYYKYFSSITNRKFDTEKHFDLIPDANSITPLLCAFLDPRLDEILYGQREITIKTITVKDVVEILKKIPEILKVIDYNLEDIRDNERNHSKHDGWKLVESQLDLSRLYKKYKHMVEILKQDSPSKVVLGITGC